MRPLIAVFSVILSAFASAAQAVPPKIHELAPPPFPYAGGQAVAVDFKQIDLNLVFNMVGQSVGRATIEFDAIEAGFPMFDLVPNIRTLRLDGNDLPNTHAPVVSAPGQVTQFRVLKSPVFANSSNVLEIEFDIDYGDVSGGRARVGFFMSDLATSGREFWEQYGPANFEFDQYSMNLHLDVKDSQQKHDAFTNGELTELGFNSWHIEFPDYFTTSSFFLHVSEQGRYQVETGRFEGINKAVPVTVYSSSSDLTRRGMEGSLSAMRELEGVFGPFAHDRVIFYITEGGGGMEHIGAAVTSLWALGHEMAHSWFARGVMPANGNAGWVDEAIASWRDDSYPRSNSAPNRTAVNLGGFSAYRRHTTQDAYTLGKKLIGEFDYMFRDVRGSNSSGMKFVLSKFFQDFARSTFSVQQFKNFLETISGQNLDAVFDRYVYGKSVKFEAPVFLNQFEMDARYGRHPRPFTAEERRLLQ